MKKPIATTQLSINKVKITSDFWTRYRDLVANVVVPYQYETISDKNDTTIGDDAFTDKEAYQDGLQSHAIENLKIAAGISKGKHVGMNFQDTDVYKWLEAAAYTLQYHPDKDLQAETDAVVDLIAKAQEPDGYLSTIFQIKFPERKFKRLQQSHKLYSMGHYIEAGVAYFEATGNQKALDIAEKMAACLEDNFGLEDNKIHGYGGHPEIELALMRLYEVTGKKEYLNLTNYFIRQRGQDPDFFDKQNEADGWDNAFWPDLNTIGNEYYYADKPVTEQTNAHGHAVRCVYLATGLAHLARVTGDQDLKDAAQRIWNDIVKKQMYITGNVGQTSTGEAFTFDYDLPTDTDYGETCASVAMTFFARQMLAGDFKGEYGDVIEKEIYNGALSGMALDGTHYFYVNPLEVNPSESAKNPDKKHVLPRRQAWFGTACCPSNITRLIASMDRYLYEVKDNTIFAHQYIANSTTFSDGIKVDQESNLPWDGTATFEITNPENVHFNFAVRIPNWSRDSFKITVNNQVIDADGKDGIVIVPITDEKTSIEVVLDMKTNLIYANSKVRANADDVAVQRGPLVYCAEQVDNPGNLWNYQLDTVPHFDFAYQDDLLNGVGVLTTNDATKVETEDDSDSLYQFNKAPRRASTKLTLIPYYSWANRDEGQMSVWLHK